MFICLKENYISFYMITFIWFYSNYSVMKQCVHVFLGPLRQDFIKIFRYCCFFFFCFHTSLVWWQSGPNRPCVLHYILNSPRRAHRLCQLIVLWHANWISTMPDDLSWLIGLGRYSQYRYSIDTDINRYVSIRPSCCIDTDDGDSCKKTRTIPDPKLLVSHLIFVQFNKNLSLLSLILIMLNLKFVEKIDQCGLELVIVGFTV